MTGQIVAHEVVFKAIGKCSLPDLLEEITFLFSFPVVMLSYFFFQFAFACRLYSLNFLRFDRCQLCRGNDLQEFVMFYSRIAIRTVCSFLPRKSLY